MTVESGHIHVTAHAAEQYALRHRRHALVDELEAEILAAHAAGWVRQHMNRLSPVGGPMLAISTPRATFIGYVDVDALVVVTCLPPSRAAA